MKEEKKQTRMAEIETAAYALFAQNGFEGTSMLAVAKQAKASNETMYRWYDDKHGLFESMVKRNAAHVRAMLEEANKDREAPLTALERLAPVLLTMLLSEKAILLNRAAASDPTGGLGRLLAKSGREDVMPLIAALMRDAVRTGALKLPKEDDIGALFIRLLVGDQQIRRVIGTLPEPTQSEVSAQARRAMAQFIVLCSSD
ncbi:MAG: TetR/AcrR family transcriptional regulator [Sulfitobacter sp.]|nr:TetR/AcrR family transcriptional regulator [Sulfitobacter sp.]